jgi:predicted nucleotidyltransferase
MQTTEPTPYEEVNQVLLRILEQVKSILGQQLVGMYLHGSLAGGDFNVQRSDIDLVVVTRANLPAETVERLAAMHQELRKGPSKWGEKIECSYIPLAGLRRYEPQNCLFPTMHVEGHFDLENHDRNWDIQRHILRERGLAVYGPPVKEIIDPVSADDLRLAAAGTLNDWWRPMLDEPGLPFLQSREYQAYAVMTMCRIIYTIERGEITTKPKAVDWVLHAWGKLDARWVGLIERAAAWPEGEQADELEETILFIRYF